MSELQFDVVVRIASLVKDRRSYAGGYQIRAPTAGTVRLTSVHQSYAEADGAFENDMTQVLISFVHKTFRTLPDGDHRAMARLSMGGMETFQVTFDYLDLFSYIGGLSGETKSSSAATPNWIRRPPSTEPWPTLPRLPGECICYGSVSERIEPDRMKAGLEALHTDDADAPGGWFQAQCGPALSARIADQVSQKYHLSLI